MAEQDDYRQINFYVDNTKQVSDGFASFKEEGGEYYFAYKNKGTIYLMSEGYSSDRARNNGIQSVEKNIKIKDRFKMMEPKNGQHYFVLKAGNNQEIAKSKSFNNEAEAQIAIAMLIDLKVRHSVSNLANIKIDAPLPPKDAATKKKRKKRSSEKKAEIEKIILSSGKYPRAGITYQIFKSGNDKHYFTFRTPDEKAVLLNANVTGFKTEAEAISKVDEVIKFGAKQANYEGKTTRNGKYYFYLKNEDGKSIAKSFFFDSPEALQTGVALLCSDATVPATTTNVDTTTSIANKNKIQKDDSTHANAALKTVDQKTEIGDSKAKEELKILEANAIKAKEEERMAKEQNEKIYKAELARVRAEQEAKEKEARAKKEKEANEAAKQNEGAVEAKQELKTTNTNTSAADDLMATLGKKNISSDSKNEENAANNNLSLAAKEKLAREAKEKAARESAEKEKEAKLKAEREAAEKAEVEKKLKELEEKKAEAKRKAEAEAAALLKLKAEKEAAEKLAAKKAAKETKDKATISTNEDKTKTVEKETIVKNIDGSAVKATETNNKESLEKPKIEEKIIEKTEEKSNIKTPLVFSNSKKEAEPLVFGKSKKETTPLVFGANEKTTDNKDTLTFSYNINSNESKALSFDAPKTNANNNTVATTQGSKRNFIWWLIPLLLIPLLLFFLWKGFFAGDANNAVMASKEKTKAIPNEVADKTKQASKTLANKVVAAGETTKNAINKGAAKTVDATKNAVEKTKNTVENTKDKVVEKTAAAAVTETATVASSVSQFKSGTIEHALNRCINDNNCYTPASINWGETNYGKNSARISSAATGSINNLALLMKTYPNVNLAIYGHISNNESDYIENSSSSLSDRRAKKMYDMLVANGVSSSRLSYKGMGNSKPIDFGDSANSDYKNRRTEVVLTSK